MKCKRLVGSFLFVMLMLFPGIEGAAVWAAGKKVFIKVPKLHTVREGDNLWDISGKNFQDNYKWRKIWNRNAFVKNPNLIYPGDQIIIPGKFIDKEVVRVSLKTSGSEKKALQPVERVPFNPPDPIPLKIIPDALFYRAGYVAAEEKWAGKVVSGPEARSIYGKGDSLVLKMNTENTVVGEKFTVVERFSQVYHPVSKKLAGTLVQEVAFLEITDVRPESATGLVKRSFSAIENGDMLVSYESSLNPPRDLLLERSASGLKGYILTGKEQRGVFGKGSVVYIDKGREDGVAPGDRFLAYKGRKVVSDKKSENGIVLPDTIYGKIEVFNVKEKNSTALVVEFVKEFYSGTAIKNVAY